MQSQTTGNWTGGPESFLDPFRMPPKVVARVNPFSPWFVSVMIIF